MEEYEVFAFEEDVNENVVFLNTTKDLYYLQDEIIEKISNKNSQARTILVDLFLRNGFTYIYNSVNSILYFSNSSKYLFLNTFLLLKNVTIIDKHKFLLYNYLHNINIEV